MTSVRVTLTPEMERFVEAEIATGTYDSVSDVLTDALRVVMTERQLDADEVRFRSEEVAAGLAQARNGEFSARSVCDIAQAVINDNGSIRLSSRRAST